ncbi:MAG: glutamate racemase [Oscillospiraceae bacterium]|nr:glutamate racemase [Oscillospiraceae bacterium]
MNRRSDPIAVFDSGVGGTSVLRHLLRILPNERYIYFGDSANAPYGTKTTEQVRELVLDLARRLTARGIKALVVACNTATGAAIEALRTQYPQLIVVGVEPALKPAADKYPGGHIGVMATPVTLEGEKFRRLLDRFAADHKITLLPAPGLADLVEAGKQDSPEGEALLKALLSAYAGKLDALVLGCTHYPFATAAIRRILGDGTELFDGGEGTAAQTRRWLETKDLLYQGPGQVLVENSLDSPEIIHLTRKLAGLE